MKTWLPAVVALATACTRASAGGSPPFDQSAAGDESVATSTREWPDLSVPTRTAADGSGDSALIVAIEHYGSVSSVPGAIRNASDWFEYFVRSRGLPISSVRLLRDNEGTVEKMRRFASEAAAHVKPGGTLWFVFVGHGAPAANGKDGVLVGYDAQQDVDSLYARSLPQGELLAGLVEGKQARSVVVVDACFSGISSSGEALTPGLQPLLVVRSRVSVPPNVVLMSAGGSDQFAGPLPGLSRPAFSYLVLGAIRGWADSNRDGAVTAAETIDYARDVLHTTLTSRTQTPELVSGDGEFLLSRDVNEAGPDLRAVVLKQAEPTPRAARLPQVPALEGILVPGGAIALNVDANVMVAYDQALRADKIGTQAPGDAANGWAKLAAIRGKNPYRAEAKQRAKAWAAVYSQQQKLAQQQTADTDKLMQLLPLVSIGFAQKESLVARYRNLYGAAAAAAVEAQVGLKLADGNEVPNDDAQAVVWFRRAAEQGNPLAQTHLGVMYNHGRGVPVNMAQAVSWYRKAAERDEPGALWILGWLYQNGLGVPQDAVEGMNYFRRAQAQDPEVWTIGRYQQREYQEQNARFMAAEPGK